MGDITSVSPTIEETSTSPGAGQITLSGAIAGALPFSSARTDGDGVTVSVSDGVRQEVLSGTFRTSPDRIEWSTVVSSTQADGGKINWPATGRRFVRPATSAMGVASILSGGSYAATGPGDHWVKRGTSATLNFTLPAAPQPGDRVRVKDIKGDALAYPITVADALGRNIDGLPSYTLDAPYGGAEFEWNGTEWSNTSGSSAWLLYQGNQTPSSGTLGRVDWRHEHTSHPWDAQSGIFWPNDLSGTPGVAYTNFVLSRDFTATSPLGAQHPSIGQVLAINANSAGFGSPVVGLVASTTILANGDQGYGINPFVSIASGVAGAIAVGVEVDIVNNNAFLPAGSAGFSALAFGGPLENAFVASNNAGSGTWVNGLALAAGAVATKGVLFGDGSNMTAGIDFGTGSVFSTAAIWLRNIQPILFGSADANPGAYIFNDTDNDLTFQIGYNGAKWNSNGGTTIAAMNNTGHLTLDGGLGIAGPASGTGILYGNSLSMATGLDFSTATFSNAAISLGDGHKLLFNGSAGSPAKMLNSGGNWQWALPDSGLSVFSHLGASRLTLNDNAGDLGISGDMTVGGTVLLKSSQALANGAAAATGTLTNAPTAGNPTKWLSVNDNGTIRYVPAW